MTLFQLEKHIKEAFINLNPSILENLDEDAVYSYDFKHEFIDKLDKLFREIKSKGISNLSVINSKCKFCYPSANTYSFHNPKTDEFIIRYVIHQESDNVYRVEQCKNNSIPDGENGMPF